MCGISGKFNYDGAPINPALLTAMTDAVTHRGPDDGSRTRSRTAPAVAGRSESPRAEVA
jgi:asparagine synthetase B (glutamine-hydrolysing)